MAIKSVSGTRPSDGSTMPGTAARSRRATAEQARSYLSTPTANGALANRANQARDARPSGQDLMRMLVRHQHRRYREWVDVWREFGYLYEGNGPYLDGSALVAHTRELTYKVDDDGQPVIPEVILAEKPKFTRRRKLARYENWVDSLIQLFVDHQFSKPVARTASMWDEASMGPHPYLAWISNVDGQGTHIDDWLKMLQVKANLYGFMWVVMDRYLPGSEPGDMPADVASAADLGRPVLRAYAPQDVPDWLVDRYGNLVSVKVMEARTRTNIMDPDWLFEEDQPDSPFCNYRVWTRDGWTLYTSEGQSVGQGDVPGFLPVFVYYSRRRAHIPVIGKPLLGDPKVFKDYYNLVSEHRSILRDQTFSMLNVVLPEKQAAGDAQKLLGNKVGTDSVLFTREHAATFIAPDSGPSGEYREEKEALLRVVYRRLGLPWESDSKDAEAEGSRQLKAMDLNRTLAGMSDEAEKAEYALARMFHQMEFGAESGTIIMEETGLTIRHPDEFYTQDLIATANELAQTLLLGLGATANAEMRKRAIPIFLRDVDKDVQATINEEIDAESVREQENRELMDEAILAPDPNGDGGGGGGDDGGGDDGGDGGGRPPG